jgi:hypothetical protein
MDSGFRRNDDGGEKTLYQSPIFNLPPSISGSVAAKEEAIKLAKAANTLDELKAAMQSFDGLAIKTTAKQIVFASGNPAASVMVIGDAPESKCAPTSAPFSSTQTDSSGLSCFNRIAQDNPAGPAPTITTSYAMLSRSVRISFVSLHCIAHSSVLGCDYTQSCDNRNPVGKPDEKYRFNRSFDVSDVFSRLRG